MVLIALILIEHEFLSQIPQVINFGGPYHFSIESTYRNKIFLSVASNTKYLDNFYNISNSGVEISNLSAIVGKNGVGKSSVLNVIRSFYIPQKHALPYSESMLLFLDKEKDLLYVDNIGENKIQIIGKEFKSIDKKSESVQTIYYYPQLDFSYNSSFDSFDDFDISFEKLLENDLEELSKKGNNEAGWGIAPTHELLFKNSMRQIRFLSSKIFTENHFFRSIYRYEQFDLAKLVFRGYVEQEAHDLPTAFRGALQKINFRLLSELNNWSSQIKLNQNNEVINQIDVNKFFLKRNIILKILSIIKFQFEKDSVYLNYGYLDNSAIYERDSKEMSGTDLFFSFIKDAKINKRSALDFEKLSNLVSVLFESINEISDVENVSNNVMIVEGETAIKILNLHSSWISSLIHYLPTLSSRDQNLVQKKSYIDGFINYQPNSRRLSSGENAFLNLFARIYDFVQNRLVEIKNLPEHKHYIILLDEADLGFHPVWKKKYIKTILQTLPLFFESIKICKSLQVIFTTHDPLSLSDLPNYNVVYLDRLHDEMVVLENNNSESCKRTFGANITDLLADSFFIEDGLIGDFAKDKINETIGWLIESKKIEDKEYYKKLIENIDEPIIRRKLAEMYDEKTKDDFYKNMLVSEMEIIKQKLNKLK